ncbi:MAG: hypothetical protein WC975_06805 [Phycisphaerae bacterium]
MLAYVFDDAVRNELNQKGINYWDVYIREILDLLGAKGSALDLKQLENPDRLNKIQTLILGSQSGQKLTGKMIKTLDAWVQDGGLLIGFGLRGLDHVFGNKPSSIIKQKPDDYTISGYFDLRPHSITHEVHHFLFVEQKLLILSDIDAVERQTSVELARLFDPTGKDMDCSAITWNPYGLGFAGYFAFDVAKTVWLLHQGKPTSHLPENRSHPRPPEMTVVGENSRKVPYADEICFLLQNMIAQHPHPFIYQIPPKDEKVADALLYWGGDEYVGPTELSLTASDWMKQQGLAYHINIQENHPMTQEDIKHIHDNGHEVSLFYHTLPDNGFKMTEALYLTQSEEFYKKVGCRPCATVNSVTRWNHWAGAAKWMLQAGGKADNSFTSNPLSLEHPMANGPFFGFSFGTAYPFYFHDDHDGKNKRVDYMEQPIVCYEIGHRGSLLDHETDTSKEVHLPLEFALKYHMTMNMFYHPAYITRYPLCRKAIQEIVKYIRDCGANVVHMGNDALAEWWEKRSESTVENLRTENDTIVFDCDCRHKGGMVVKVLLKQHIVNVSLDTRWPAEYEIRKEFAGSWLFVNVPFGKHDVRIKLS